MSVSISFTYSANADSDGINCSYPASSLGAEASDRIIAICVHGESNTAPPSSCTVDGVTADLAASISNTASAPDLHVYWYTVSFPTGTEADIEFAMGTGSWRIGVFQIVGGVLSPLSDSDTSQGSGVSLDLTALTIPTNGAGIVGFTNASAATAVVWTNATESYDTTGGASAYRCSGAIVTGVGTNTITADAATGQQCMAGIAFDPVPSGKGPPFDSMKHLRHLLVR